MLIRFLRTFYCCQILLDLVEILCKILEYFMMRFLKIFVINLPRIYFKHLLSRNSCITAFEFWTISINPLSKLLTKPTWILRENCKILTKSLSVFSFLPRCQQGLYCYLTVRRAIKFFFTQDNNNLHKMKLNLLFQQIMYKFS